MPKRPRQAGLARHFSWLVMSTSGLPALPTTGLRATYRTVWENELMISLQLDCTLSRI
jgi:hypothetical protein